MISLPAMSVLVLLGPQRLNPTVGRVLDDLDLPGPVATVTAGWQEREAEVEELAEALGEAVVNLRLYERAEATFDADAELAAAYRRRQEQLRRLQQVYRLRLDPTLAAARLMLAFEGESWLVGPERKRAIAAVRRLDNQHLGRIRRVHADFEAEIEPLERPAVRRQRAELAELLSGVGTLAIAGGHVAVLLNRLRLFGILELAAGLPVIAWSAGAMALGERIVLFHDHPPQGAGNAEILEHGLGLMDDVVPLPHARRRLDLADRQRISLFARRFAPARCVALDDGSRLVRDAAGDWTAGTGTHRLTPRGKVRQLSPTPGKAR